MKSKPTDEIVIHKSDMAQADLLVQNLLQSGGHSYSRERTTEIMFETVRRFVNSYVLGMPMDLAVQFDHRGAFERFFNEVVQETAEDESQ